MKPDSVVLLPTNEESLFIHWLRMLQPFHNMVEKELIVASEILRLRYSLSKSTDNESLIDSSLFQKENRKKIIDRIEGMNPSYFNVILTKLRGKKFLLGDIVNPKFIPKINEKGKFTLLTVFTINDL